MVGSVVADGVALGELPADEVGMASLVVTDRAERRPDGELAKDVEHLRCPLVDERHGANLDAEVFPDPKKFDIRRANANKHLGLGRGRHACVGQPLVRIEAPIGLRKLYERMPDLRIDLSQPVEYLPSFGVSNIARIRAKWSGGATPR